MSNFSLFSVLGIEIEYMIVDKDTLCVQPHSDLILRSLAGKLVNQVELGEIAASNELVMHVIELKNNGPKSLQTPVAQQFYQTLLQLQPLLQKHNLQLLPTGAHPWMDPLRETVRWSHDNKKIYDQFDAIFNCEGHGWANLQSMHVNMPFANDVEFCQLHNSLRLLLPLLPALAASTPFLDSQPTGYLDSRLTFYEKNQRRIPSISGQVIPEFIHTQEEYQQEILLPMYKAINEYDPEGILQFEWLNSRAAIAKFEQMAIEVRILDSQECVNADIAIAHVIHGILKNWDASSTLHLEKPYDTTKLKNLYDQTIRVGMQATIEDPELLTQWQLPTRRMTAHDAWTLLIERVSPDLNYTSQVALEHILTFGNLSERILQACNQDFSRGQLTTVYKRLGDCLLENKQFKSL